MSLKDSHLAAFLWPRTDRLCRVWDHNGLRVYRCTSRNYSSILLTIHMSFASFGPVIWLSIAFNALLLSLLSFAHCLESVVTHVQ